MENETLAELIDLTVFNTQSISTLRRQVAALIAVVTDLHPALAKSYVTAFAEADERGEKAHELTIEAAQKLAAKRDQLRKKGKESK
jgi:hypothetical protein